MGKVMDKAASWLGSPICPTKKVSARLYKITTIWLITVGMASLATALPTGMVVNNSLLFFCILSAPFYSIRLVSAWRPLRKH